MAVGNLRFFTAIPSVTVFEVGVEGSRRKEAVLNGNLTVGPTHETTIRMAVGTLNAAVEPTVAERDIGIRGSYMADETTHSGIAIYAVI